MTSRAFYDLAHHPRIIEVIAPLVGDDIILWGATIVRRGAGAVHPWHSDIESSTCGGKTVSVWIGLENTTPESSLLLLPRTHRFGVTIQEVALEKGRNRKSTTDDDVIRWARERDGGCRLVQPDIGDGEALFFDGRLWHGSNNRFAGARRALLLQYATPESQVRIPDMNFIEWPFRHLERPRPPCIMVQGQGDPAKNRIVPGPLPDDSGAKCELGSCIHPLPLPLALPEGVQWKPHHLMQGATAALCHLSGHASALAPGHIPHPPHRHIEEELLLLLEGEVELLLPEAPPVWKGNRLRLKAGEFVYYPADFAHTLQTVSETPANYLMFKWHNEGAAAATDVPLPFDRWSFREQTSSAPVRPGFHPHALFGAPTRWLRKLSCHTTTLAPGSGYEPHVDAYDVAIVVLSGQVETLGARARPHDVIFYRAGEPHGMRNPGDEPAHYVVFEFHGRERPIVASWPRRLAVLVEKLADPVRWRRKAGRLARRLRAGQ